MKGWARDFITSMPGDMLHWARKAEESLKVFFSPGLLFEALNFRYVGPIDGHNFEHLLPTLGNVLKLKGPTLLHVITKKGLGFEPAMSNPVWFHACSPFNGKTGEPVKKAGHLSYSAIAANTLSRQARKDGRVVAITAAMCEGTGLSNFQKEFPTRLIDVGIAEQHAVTYAAGLAAENMRPVICLYSTFHLSGP